MTDPLAALARRAQDELFFLASLLAAFAQSEGLDDASLAAALGCPQEELVMLRLCRAPREGPGEFGEDVESIAGRFGIDPQRLAEVVKRGRVVHRLRMLPAADGFLAAARDREPEPPPPPPETP